MEFINLSLDIIYEIFEIRLHSTTKHIPLVALESFLCDPLRTNWVSSEIPVVICCENDEMGVFLKKGYCYSEGKVRSIYAMFGAN